MDLHLSFANGAMTGDGSDDIGRFVIRGRYEASRRECWWTKIYPGSHEVSYHGFRDGNGIWGTWEIRPWSKGGFHIWPRRRQEGEGQARFEEMEQPVKVTATLITDVQ